MQSRRSNGQEHFTLLGPWQRPGVAEAPVGRCKGKASPSAGRPLGASSDSEPRSDPEPPCKVQPALQHTFPTNRKTGAILGIRTSKKDADEERELGERGGEKLVRGSTGRRPREERHRMWPPATLDAGLCIVTRLAAKAATHSQLDEHLDSNRIGQGMVGLTSWTVNLWPVLS